MLSLNEQRSKLEAQVLVAENYRPDFEVRHLAEYSADDLNKLLFAVSYAFEMSKKSDDKKTALSLDVWSYRLREAIKEAAEAEGRSRYAND
jgi:hypothetical protein